MSLGQAVLLQDRQSPFEAPIHEVVRAPRGVDLAELLVRHRERDLLAEALCQGGRLLDQLDRLVETALGLTQGREAEQAAAPQPLDARLGQVVEGSAEQVLGATEIAL